MRAWLGAHLVALFHQNDEIWVVTLDVFDLNLGVLRRRRVLPRLSLDEELQLGKAVQFSPRASLDAAAWCKGHAKHRCNYEQRGRRRGGVSVFFGWVARAWLMRTTNHPQHRSWHLACGLFT